MYRSYKPVNGRFEFNSEDSCDHPYGDFVLFGDCELIIDGRNLGYFPSISGWWFFHRDSDGIIDHIFPYENTGISMKSHLDKCALCNPTLKTAIR